MKKLLALSLLLGSVLIFAPASYAADAKSNSAASAGVFEQNRYNQRYRINRRGARIVTRTRIVRRGYRTYREVWQYRYLPNGRTDVRLLSRTRIR